MTTTKTKIKLWPPIHALTYTNGTTAWQVACMVNGKRIREAYPTKAEAETRAAEIRIQVENEGRAAFTMPTAVRVEAHHILAVHLRNEKPPIGANGRAELSSQRNAPCRFQRSRNLRLRIAAARRVVPVRRPILALFPAPRGLITGH